MKRRVRMLICVISMIIAIIFAIDLFIFEFKNFGVTDLQIIINRPISVIGMTCSLILAFIGLYLIKNTPQDKK